MHFPIFQSQIAPFSCVLPLPTSSIPSISSNYCPVLPIVLFFIACLAFIVCHNLGLPFAWRWAPCAFLSVEGSLSLDFHVNLILWSLIPCHAMLGFYLPLTWPWLGRQAIHLAAVSIPREAIVEAADPEGTDASK